MSKMKKKKKKKSDDDYLPMKMYQRWIRDPDDGQLRINYEGEWLVEDEVTI